MKHLKTKKCCLCQKRKKTSDFRYIKNYRQYRKLDNRFSYCFSCERQYNNNRYAKPEIKDRRKIQIRSFNRIFWRSRFEARKVKKLVWTITKEDFAALRKLLCVYCDGSLPEVGIGLDRINNNLGYTKNNVVPCCTICNKIKNNILTYDQMIQLKPFLIKFRLEREIENGYDRDSNNDSNQA
jgi:hypothetical protein